MDISLPATGHPASEPPVPGGEDFSKSADNLGGNSVFIPESGNDEDDEWEVLNEEVVYADCHGVIEPDVLVPNNPISLVSLDSDHPLVQIGPAVFEGHYENACGTYLFVERAGNSSSRSNLSRAGPFEQGHMTTAMDQPSSTKHPPPPFPLIQCTKTLILDRIFLNLKQSEGSAASPNSRKATRSPNPEN